MERSRPRWARLVAGRYIESDTGVEVRGRRLERGDVGRGQAGRNEYLTAISEADGRSSFSAGLKKRSDREKRIAKMEHWCSSSKYAVSTSLYGQKLSFLSRRRSLAHAASNVATFILCRCLEKTSS